MGGKWVPTGDSGSRRARKRIFMSKHLQRDIDHLNSELLNISSMVEEMIDKATQALSERRIDLADQVVNADSYVDQVDHPFAHGRERSGGGLCGSGPNRSTELR